MEDNKQKANEALLDKILNEVEQDAAAFPQPTAEEKKEVQKIMDAVEAAEPAAEAAEEDVRTAARPRREDLHHTASRKSWTHDLSPEDEALYEDLNGISQTQMRRRENAHNASNSKRSKPKKKKRNRLLRSLIMTGVILAISFTLAFLIITYGRDVLGINNDNTTKIVTIPQGSGTGQIAEILESEGIISYPSLFKFMAGMSGKDGDFTAGDHELRPDMAYDTIFENLASPSLGNSEVVEIAFQEGIYLCDAAKRLEQQGVCDADEFIEYFNENARYGLAYENYLPNFTNEKFYKMEGYLFPDTYQFYQNMEVDLVCQKILKNFNSKITKRDYERMKTLGISLDETLTLASIIQMEAGSVDQMSRISSVFWNRMNHSESFPKLQSDPTINYVENVIKPHIAVYDEEMFEAYNTYESNGLPPGAISNPGYDAIQAALYPATTDYYYFYSNLDTGETYFSRTLSEHEAWIQKVQGNQYVATAPVEGEDGEEEQSVMVGVGTSVATTPAEDGSVTTTTAAVNEWGAGENYNYGW